MKLKARQTVWFSLLLMLVVGCRGCTPAAPVDSKSKEQKKRVSSDDVRALPYGKDSVGVFLKPGHWYQANQKLMAHKQDETISSSLIIYDRSRIPVPMFQGYPPISFQRNLSLARGQFKNIRLQLFQSDVPMSNEGEFETESKSTPSYLGVSYFDRATNTPLVVEEYPSRLLQGYQYNLVNLSADPSRYLFWRGLPLVFWPSEERLANERYNPYRVCDINEDEIASQFPSRLYAMTSISHIVFNNASPARFSSEQQDAFLDWLHFGGTVILNGPDAVGGVDSSFLKPYSPLMKTTTRDWTEAETTALNNDWTIRRFRGAKTDFIADHPIPKLVGELAEEARWVEGLEGIVAERYIGQGRIVMTTFPMTDSSFLRWPSYDSFIHNAILRKPKRDVLQKEFTDMVYASPYVGGERSPALSTRFRLWARDLDSSTAVSVTAFQKRSEARDDNSGEKKQTQSIDQSARFPVSKRTGYGSWTADSLIMQSARASLQQSAGISVPKVQTIIRLLIGYLIVLVPLNWLIFRLVGRVELAWVAAPVISIIGAIAVARGVQLDVGFSRSQNTLALLEVHPGYDRGVLSSYHALYTSLSTKYQALYQDDVGIVSPMPTSRSESGANRRPVDPTLNYWFADAKSNGIQNHWILSNTTGMLQSEEVVSLDGNFQATFDESLSELRFTNRMGVPVKDIGVIGLANDGTPRHAWIGETPAGVEKTFELKKDGTVNRWLDPWDKNAATKRPDFLQSDGTRWIETVPENELYLGAMIELLATQYPLAKGEFIAIGRTEESASQMALAPESRQQRAGTVVLMHLRTSQIQGKPVPDSFIFPVVQNESEDPRK